MSRTTKRQKAGAMLELLMGLSSPRIANELSRYGFDDGELSRGWALLEAAGRVPPVETKLPRHRRVDRDNLARWENEWRSVVDASLRFRHPDVAEALRHGIESPDGAEVLVTAGFFIERLERLAGGGGWLGREGEAARELLEKRGLTREVIAEGRALLASSRHMQKNACEGATVPTPEEASEAEDAMWGFYLEWTQLARRAIKSRAMLRMLGMRKGAGRSDESEQAEEAAPTQPA